MAVLVWDRSTPQRAVKGGITYGRGDCQNVTNSALAVEKGIHLWSGDCQNVTGQRRALKKRLERWCEQSWLIHDVSDLQSKKAYSPKVVRKRDRIQLIAPFEGVFTMVVRLSGNVTEFSLSHLSKAFSPMVVNPLGTSMDVISELWKKCLGTSNCLYRSAYSASTKEGGT